MPGLVGYLDRVSARPGEALAVKVSAAMPYRADLVRIRHADPNPAGPGMRLIPVPADWAGEHPARVQEVALGSHGEAEGELALGGAFTLLLRLQPWLLGGVPVALELGGHALRLVLSEEGLRAEADEVACAVPPPLPRRWYEVSVRVGDGRLRLEQRALSPIAGRGDEGVAEAALPEEAEWSGAARIAFGRGHDGRLEDPMLLEGLAPAGLEAPEDLLAGGRVLAWWDFSRGMGTEAIEDRGPGGLHGRLVNLPSRAMRGSRWRGAEHCWRHAPRDYAAIHFHTDDLADCGWETAFDIRIPEGMTSGVYGVRLRAGGAEDVIPFYVLPPKGEARERIAFLAPTFTYQAYANHARGNLDEAFRARIAAWGAYPHNPDEHHGFSHSTYNRHPDGSGIGITTRLRPILTMRPGFLTFDDPRGSGLRHFPADSHITDWLEERGFGFDVVTDEDLDAEGVGLLAPYKAVVTGTHPEYHTQGTLDALQSYVDGGGRLAYLGGNGFYWKVARRGPVLELRRAEGGIRAWAAEPGEYFHQFDGTLGGLWRRNGRPPQLLCGVGFSGQGAFEGAWYRRLPVPERLAWVFEGIKEERLGDFGLSGGGAAGFELDRADPLLGTPPGTVILARSEGHQPHFVTVPEELLGRLTTINGEPAPRLVRAEIVYGETAGGGAFFSTGSITFAGSLSHNGYDNPISRLLENVLRRFGA